MGALIEVDGDLLLLDLDPGRDVEEISEDLFGLSPLIFGLSNRFSVIFFRACREELLHLCFPAGQV